MSKTKPGEVVARGARFKTASLQRVLRILVMIPEVGITFFEKVDSETVHTPWRFGRRQPDPVDTLALMLIDSGKRVREEPEHHGKLT